MKIIKTRLDGVTVVESTPAVDARGSFVRLFCEQELTQVMGNRRIVQINHSRTSSVGTVRGMHFQRPPYAEMKLIRCLKGRVWDVAVDLRAGSPTLLKWHAEELLPDDARMLIIPEGCAHGFQTLEPESELLYLHTAAYMPSSECGVAYDDPQLSIDWPLPVTSVSARDRSHSRLSPDFGGVIL